MAKYPGGGRSRFGCMRHGIEHNAMPVKMQDKT
jgi:hypothetical protein